MRALALQYDIDWDTNVATLTWQFEFSHVLLAETAADASNAASDTVDDAAATAATAAKARRCLACARGVPPRPHARARWIWVLTARARFGF